MDNSKEESKLYLVDDRGAVPAEVARYCEVSGITHSLCQHSSSISDVISGLRALASQLGEGRTDNDGSAPTNVKPYAFQSEAASREELLRIAKFLSGLNVKIWSVSRGLAKDAEELSGRIHSAEDSKLSVELEKYLETGQSVMG